MSARPPDQMPAWRRPGASVLALARRPSGLPSCAAADGSRRRPECLLDPDKPSAPPSPRDRSPAYRDRHALRRSQPARASAPNWVQHSRGAEPRLPTPAPVVRSASLTPGPADQGSVTPGAWRLSSQRRRLLPTADVRACASVRRLQQASPCRRLHRRHPFRIARRPPAAPLRRRSSVRSRRRLRHRHRSIRPTPATDAPPPTYGDAPSRPFGQSQQVPTSSRP